MLAALMDSVISQGPLSADRQSGRRWQVKNTLLAKRLRRGRAVGTAVTRSHEWDPSCWTFGWPNLSSASSSNWLNSEFEFAKEHGDGGVHSASFVRSGQLAT